MRRSRGRRQVRRVSRKGREELRIGELRGELLKTIDQPHDVLGGGDEVRRCISAREVVAERATGPEHCVSAGTQLSLEGAEEAVGGVAAFLSVFVLLHRREQQRAQCRRGGFPPHDRAQRLSQAARAVLQVNESESARHIEAVLVAHEHYVTNGQGKPRGRRGAAAAADVGHDVRKLRAAARAAVAAEVFDEALRDFRHGRVGGRGHQHAAAAAAQDRQQLRDGARLPRARGALHQQHWRPAARSRQQHTSRTSYGCTSAGSGVAGRHRHGGRGGGSGRGGGGRGSTEIARG